MDSLLWQQVWRFWPFQWRQQTLFKEGGIALGSPLSHSSPGLSNEDLVHDHLGPVAIGLIALAGGMLILVVAAAGAQYFAVGMIILTATALTSSAPIHWYEQAFAAVLGICATTGAAAFFVRGSSS